MQRRPGGISTNVSTPFTGPYGLDQVAAPIINTKALADANITVAVRVQSPLDVPPSVEFAANGTDMIVDMSESITGYITLRRPHTATR